MTTRKKSGSGAGVDFQIEGKAATRAIVLHVDRRDRGAPPTSDRAVEARLEEAVGLALAIDLEVEAAIVAPVTAPKPATLPWPKIAQTPSTKRAPSSDICTDSQRTIAWAAVRRIVVILHLP